MEVRTTLNSIVKLIGQMNLSLQDLSQSVTFFHVDMSLD